MFVYTYMYLHTYICTHICMYTHKHVHIYVCIYMYSPSYSPAIRTSFVFEKMVLIWTGPYFLEKGSYNSKYKHFWIILYLSGRIFLLLHIFSFVSFPNKQKLNYISQVH